MGFNFDRAHNFDFNFTFTVLIIYVLKILVIIAIIAGIIYLIKWTKKHGVGYNMNDDPITILKKRYAAGEITKEEYEKIKSDLLN